MSKFKCNTFHFIKLTWTTIKITIEPMRLFIYFLSLLATLSACSSTTSVTKTTSTQEQQSTVLSPQTTSIEIKEDIDELTSKNAKNITKESTEQVASIDIWQRIRQGYGLPDMDSKLIIKYENWNRKHSDYIQEMLQRGNKYLFHIVEQIEQRNMPMEIALLPAIESAYKTKATSRSNASGLWQFIPATGRYFGMRQDWWSDQRRDILISTDAALDYLQSLHGEFNGDWLLALAAYNGGKGTIAKAIKRNIRNNKIANLENLQLRKETTHYVPKLIALSRVIMNPALYDIQLPKINNEPYFVIQEMAGQTDLLSLVKNTNLSRSDLDELNASFLRWASDPKGPHRIIVPIQHQASVANYLDNAPKLGRLNWREHLILKGETMKQIARKYSVSLSAIRSINGMKNNTIHAGKIILIPLEKGKIRTKQQDNQYTNSSPSSSQDWGKHSKQLSTKTYHQVKQGDTLWGIARHYGLSVADLITWNNISKTQILALNQVIKLSNH